MIASAVKVGSHWYGVLKDGDKIVWQSKVPHNHEVEAKNQAAYYRAHNSKSLAGMAK